MVPKFQEMQLAIFPDWNEYLADPSKFFPKIADLREYLFTRREQVTSDVRGVIDVLLESNDQFERWATERLAEKGILVKSPVAPNNQLLVLPLVCIDTIPV